MYIGAHRRSSIIPTDSEELIIGQIKFRTFDLGGHETGESDEGISRHSEG